MELPHNRGNSGDRGCTKCLPAIVLDSEVVEHIGGGETSFWDKRAIEQGLMVDMLGLPGNEPVGIFRRRWCRPRVGARSLSFGRDRFLWSHHGQSRVRDLQTQKKKKNERKKGKGDQILCGGENKKPFGYLKDSKITPTTLWRRALHCG